MKKPRKLLALALSVLMLGTSLPAYATQPDASETFAYTETESQEETDNSLEETQSLESSVEIQETEASETEVVAIETETTETEAVESASEESETEIPETEVSETEEVQLLANSAVVQNLLAGAQYVADYIRVNGYSYGSGSNQITCDRFVCWALYQAGYDMAHPGGIGLWALPTWCEQHGFQKITRLADCQAGDIMFQSWDNGASIGHTYILGNPQDPTKTATYDTMWGRYDGGADRYIQNRQPIITWKIASEQAFVCAYRPNANGLNGQVTAPSTPSPEVNFSQMEVSGLTATSTTQGVRLNWNAVTAASVTGYYVYGKNGDNSNYHYIGATTNTSFVDTKASMTTYNYYWVMPYYKKVSTVATEVGTCSKYVYGKKLTSTQTITVSSVGNFRTNSTASGVSLMWTACPGVTTYAIYKKTANSSLKYLTTVSTTSFLDRSASLSEFSFYWVYPYITINGKQYFGKCPSYKYAKTLITANNFDQAKVANITKKATTSGIILSWTKLPEVAGYEIYRKVGSGAASFVAQVTTGTYTDQGASPLADNTYIIYPYRLVDSGKSKGASTQYNAGKAVLSDVTIKSAVVSGLKATRENNGVRLTWNKVEGAHGYYVYTRTDTVSMHYIGMTATTQLLHTSPAAKNNYYWVYPYYKTSNGQVYIGSCQRYAFN